MLLTQTVIAQPEAYIIYSTKAWDIDVCPDNIKGFRVGKRADNGKLIFYCGKESGPRIYNSVDKNNFKQKQGE